MTSPDRVRAALRRARPGVSPKVQAELERALAELRAEVETMPEHLLEQTNASLQQLVTEIEGITGAASDR